MPFLSDATGAGCAHCGEKSILISGIIGFCLDCIRSHFDAVWPIIAEHHRRSRKNFGLPSEPPDSSQGVSCPFCINECRIPEGGWGYCGMRQNIRGKLAGASPNKGNLSWYHDPLPTNCVADWVCPGGSPAGYPTYSHSSGPEYGYKNLAVFYQACTFNCLFCQNWHYRERVFSERWIAPEELVASVDGRTRCICYFGGDPSPQLPHAIKASRLALEKRRGGILRICWETNGAMKPRFLRSMFKLSLASGGCIKFDLKALDERLNLALCGVSNRQTLENFAWLARRAKERPDPPLLIASTLLIPGYIDAAEVARIARFIASLNPNIPYALLGFHPHFFMHDLPATSKRHAFECRDAAAAEGLKNVRIGNLHLLGDDY